MKNMKWVILIIVAALLGFFVVEYMTVHPLRMSLFLVLSTLTAVALIFIIIKTFKGKWILPAAIFISLAAFLSSYLISTQLFLETGRGHSLPKITRLKGDPGDGHTAVIYFTHGEPETYDPIGWINQFNEFDEQGI